MTYDTLIVGSHIITPTGIIDKNMILDDVIGGDAVKSVSQIAFTIK